MRHRPWLASLIACAAVCHSVFAAEETAKAADPYAKDPYWYQPGHPVSPAEATAIKTAPGFKAERVLTVPREMGSWTALCVDPQGRLITSAQQQPGLFRVTPPPLDDSGAEAKVEKLGGVAARIGWSQGLLYAFDSLYVTVTEENDQLEHGVYRLQDTDGDGEFDRSTFLFKLDGSGEHGPHNLVVSPDGRAVVMACGNGTRVPADLQNRRPTATTGVDHLMPPGFASSHYSAQGWILRFDPDGNNRELILGGLRNSFDLAFDESGELFTFDSDAEWDLGTPWYRPTRICHLVSGGEYGWRDDAAVWPEYFDDSVAPVRNIGPGSPSGLTFGYGAKFPAKYQRALFVCDWTFATVHAIFLKPDGASYRADVE
jgi:glucose/arabinose dehydrogenase